MTTEGADRDEEPVLKPDSYEQRLRVRLKGVVVIVFLTLISILTLADTFGVGIASQFIFGALLGSTLLVLGVEGAHFMEQLLKVFRK